MKTDSLKKNISKRVNFKKDTFKVCSYLLKLVCVDAYAYILCNLVAYNEKKK